MNTFRGGEHTEEERPTFSEQVEKVNLAFLVRVPSELLGRLAQLVEDDLNEVGATLIYQRVSNNRLRIEDGQNDRY